MPADQIGLYGSPNGRIPSRILVDGFSVGRWRTSRKGRLASLVLQPITPLAAADRRLIEAEAQALIGFIHPDADEHSVVFELP